MGDDARALEMYEIALSLVEARGVLVTVGLTSPKEFRVESLIVRMILHSIHRENRIDVAHLTVGWSVPRDIELYTFSDPVLSRVSELGSCRYFVAEDQIAIVSPDEEKVVYLIDRS